ncbi:amino acid permease [Tundrisphaera sp. TA3]|uniref:amino acid permease n=1 Tax=Tundrisphaera sp. TA3 TaxID=3435775 RepID=UPI003EB9E4F7
MPDPQTALGRDVDDLAGFGYKQRLDRTLGGFSSFAAGFSYLSILTGLPQLFHLGYAAGGPAFFWTWPLMLAGQFLVALCFAELAADYPLSGGVYQWANRVSPGPVGWMAGWVYLACAVITLAAVALALQSTLPQISPAFQLVGQVGDPTDAAKNAVILGTGLIAFSTLINAVGVKLLARINNVGVFAEMAGAIILAILLFTAVRRGSSVVLDTQGRGEGLAWGYFAPFCAAALTPSFVMYGFDTAGALAEETDNPRKRAPRAILGALAAVGIMGTLLLLGALRAAPDLRDPALGQISGGMPAIIKSALGSGWGRLLLIDVVLAIVVCTLTVHAAAVRLVFAMARDNNLPFSVALARLPEKTRSPLVAAVMLGVCAFAILIANVGHPRIVEVLASVSIVWANLAYLLVTAPLLVKRIRYLGRPRRRRAKGLFDLGRWGLPINALAVAWGVVVIVNISWPREAIYGDDEIGRYAAPIATIALLALGALYYVAIGRRESAGVIEEHRATRPAPVADIGMG